MRSRRGVTFPELLIVICIAGVLLAVVVPRYGKVAGAMNVRSAKHEMASLLTQGRATAIQTNRTVQVVRTSDLISLITDNGAGPEVIEEENLGAKYGVSVSATRDTVAYDSRGMVNGNSGILKFVVTDGVTRDSVCLIALGKISSTGCSL